MDAFWQSVQLTSVQGSSVLFWCDFLLLLFFGFGLYKRNDGACVGKNIIHKYIISYLRLYQYALRLYHPEALQCSLWQSLMMYIVAEEWYNLNAYLSSPPVFSGVRVTRSLVLYVCFIDRCLSCCTFSFGHCVVCSSSIYGFWLPLWYLQTLLVNWIVLQYSWRHL
jgi:hypothetical protein